MGSARVSRATALIALLFVLALSPDGTVHVDDPAAATAHRRAFRAAPFSGVTLAAAASKSSVEREIQDRDEGNDLAADEKLEAEMAGKEYDEDEEYDEDADVEDDDDDDVDDDDEGEDADDDDDDEDEEDDKKEDREAVLNPPGSETSSESYDMPTAKNAVFFEHFQNGMSSWVSTESEGYNGEFALGQGASPAIPGDVGLIIPRRARKYGLSTAFSGLDDMSDKNLVVQYEVKLEEDLTCGGAYVKLPLPGFEPDKFNGDTPYSIMFGPDKCGATQKVHVIFQSTSPTGKRFEHHLKNAPGLASSSDKRTHLYTLAVNASGEFAVFVDMEEKINGTLKDDLDPPMQPFEEIDDPEDKKPDDWVDAKKIPDPDAKKPDDWDESAPRMIDDMDAVKPEGWLDDEPEKIPDPKATKPEEWDDDEDGDWEAPQINNPKCEAVGCGEWKRPKKTNPDYRGKWTAPLIDNPAYIGEWKPKKIANPDYYKVEKHHALGIGGIGFELWTMDQGVVFDNLFIGSSLDDALAVAEQTFMDKKNIEAARAEKLKEERDRLKAERRKKAEEEAMNKKLDEKDIDPVDEEDEADVEGDDEVDASEDDDVKEEL